MPGGVVEDPTPWRRAGKQLGGLRMGIGVQLEQLREEQKVRGYLNYLEAWVQATRKQMDSAVEAEGAVV